MSSKKEEYNFKEIRDVESEENATTKSPTLSELQRPRIATTCVDCKGENVHSIEFRTDYAKPRAVSSVNQWVDEIKDDAIPYQLNGYYCHDCQTFCSVERNEAV